MSVQRLRICLRVAAFSLAFCCEDVWAKKYVIDPVHSAVSFKVKHLVISKVQGTFDKFSGEFFYDEKNPDKWNAQATIDANSINTANADRDEHLRSPDFLDVEKYSKITFKSTKVTDFSENKAKLHGDLAIHGTTKAVVLDLEIGGVAKDPWGNERSGFEATTKINRKDFGVAFHKVLETGGLVVDDIVEIILHIEGIEQKKAPKEEVEKESPAKKK